MRETFSPASLVRASKSGQYLVMLRARRLVDCAHGGGRNARSYESSARERDQEPVRVAKGQVCVGLLLVRRRGGGSHRVPHGKELRDIVRANEEARVVLLDALDPSGLDLAVGVADDILPDDP